MQAPSQARHALTAAAVVALLAAIAVAVLVPGRSGGAPVTPVTGPASRAITGPEGRVQIAGPWTYRGDRKVRGTSYGWSKGGFSGRRVRLPYVPNARTITGRKARASHQGTVGWYKAPLRVGVNGRYAIRFESVNHRATVWIDGHRVASHTGAYEPFEAHVNLRAGRMHKLVVRADWRNPKKMKREGWHRLWFNYGGINREVTVRALPAVTVTAPRLTTRLDGGTARVQVSALVRNTGAPRTVHVRGALQRPGRQAELDFGEVELGRRQARTVTKVVEVDDAELWSPAQPNLWQLKLDVDGQDGGGYRALTGLREVDVRDGRIMLNGRRIFLRGASIHEDVRGRGDGLRPSDMDQIVGELHGLGANATRVQHPLDPALLERLDAAGILVWQEVGPVDAPGNWTSRTPKLRRRATDRVMRTLEADQPHPSILTWNLANEVAFDGHRSGQAAWIDSAARHLKALDPGRPIALDIWGDRLPRKRPGRMYRDIDMVGATNYLGWYELPFANSDQIAAAIRGRIRRLRRKFPEKAIVVTEFGAEANSRNPTNAHGGYAYQSKLLATHLRTYAADPLVNGELVWNLRDFGVTPSFAGGSITRALGGGIKLVPGLNQKGLITHGGHEKPAFATVRRAYARLQR